MPSPPMVERNGTHPPLLSAQSNGGHLLPSPLPPPSASSLSVSSQRPRSAVSAVSSSHDRGDQVDGTAAARKSHSYSVSSNPQTVASSKASTSADTYTRDKQRPVRTLPPWVQSADEDDNAEITSLLLPRTPTSARPASHNFMPTPKSTVPGRKFDHAREGAPVTLTTPLSEHASKWQRFARSSEYDRDRPPSSRGQIVDDDWMKQNMPDLEEPWQPMNHDEKDEATGFWLFSRRKRARFRKAILNHPMVPLVVRMIVLTFSVLALALAGSIFHKSDTQQGCSNNSSTYMAIIVDVIAIVYTTYITYDEYTSKPLGLRSHNAKMRLIFLDLLFIVFDSANLSIAFQALTDDRWACRDSSTPQNQSNLYACPYRNDICSRQKGLTATLLIALLAWLGTFAISTLRYKNLDPIFATWWLTCWTDLSNVLRDSLLRSKLFSCLEDGPMILLSRRRPCVFSCIFTIRPLVAQRPLFGCFSSWAFVPHSMASLVILSCVFGLHPGGVGGFLLFPHSVSEGRCLRLNGCHVLRSPVIDALSLPVGRLWAEEEWYGGLQKGLKWYC